MSGREVGVVYEYRSTRDAGDRGGDHYFAVSPDTPRRSGFRPPCTAIRGYRHALPAPSRRGREEALMSGREVGVVYEYRSTRDAGDRGGSGQS